MDRMVLGNMTNLTFGEVDVVSKRTKEAFGFVFDDITVGVVQ